MNFRCVDPGLGFRIRHGAEDVLGEGEGGTTAVTDVDGEVVSSAQGSSEFPLPVMFYIDKIPVVGLCGRHRHNLPYKIIHVGLARQAMQTHKIAWLRHRPDSPCSTQGSLEWPASSAAPF